MTSPNSNNTSETEKKEESTSWLWWIVLAVVVILIIAAIAYYGTRKSNAEAGSDDTKDAAPCDDVKEAPPAASCGTQKDSCGSIFESSWVPDGRRSSRVDGLGVSPPPSGTS